MDIRDNKENDKNYILSIKSALEMGITHIDTAEMYAEGYCEILVGKAIKNFDRSKLTISTKISPINLTYQRIVRSAKNSLNRLGISYIDIYIVHYPNYKISITETMEAMDYLVEKKLVKYIGVSNFNKQQFVDAQKCCKNKIVLNQIPYSLINRTFQINGYINYAKKNDIMTVAWSPIERGVLAKRGIKLLDKICDKYRKTPSQVAINWLINQKNVVTIPASKKINHLKENLGALNWSLTIEDQKILDLNFPGKEHISGANEYWNNIIN